MTSIIHEIILESQTSANENENQFKAEFISGLP
jgi:hypothetical protein